MQGKSNDRNAQQPAGGQLLTELKFLKAQIVKKDARIKELEESLAVANAEIATERRRLLGPGPVIAGSGLDGPA